MERSLHSTTRRRIAQQAIADETQKKENYIFQYDVYIYITLTLREVFAREPDRRCLVAPFVR